MHTVGKQNRGVSEKRGRQTWRQTRQRGRHAVGHKAREGIITQRAVRRQEAQAEVRALAAALEANALADAARWARIIEEDQAVFAALASRPQPDLAAAAVSGEVLSALLPVGVRCKALHALHAVFYPGTSSPCCSHTRLHRVWFHHYRERFLVFDAYLHLLPSHLDPKP